MKTISEIAKEENVSRQYVYESVKKAGLKLEEMTREKQGKQMLYSDSDVASIVMSIRDNGKHVSVDRSDTKKRVKDLENECRQLHEELKKKNTEIADLKKQLEFQTMAHAELIRTHRLVIEKLADGKEQKRIPFFQKVKLLFKPNPTQSDDEKRKEES